MSQAVPAPRLRPFEPVRFGRYTLVLPIAQGGMGEVLLARLDGPRGLGKWCVIKRILPDHADTPEFVERFVNEAKALEQLSHGSIAQVLDMGVEDGRPFLALEYIDGKDLRRVLARVRDLKQELPLPFILSVACRVLEGLSYAHRKRDENDRLMGLVHRDISPQNILLSYEGEVKIIDFGLVKSALNVGETHPSMVLGKFWYMSPEQAGNQPVDFRSDLYSLGLCLYELIAGKNPFGEVPSGALPAAVKEPKFPPLWEAAPSCPREVAEAVMKALAVDPEKRFASALLFRKELERCLVKLEAPLGPEGLSECLREWFSADYEKERKMLASLRERAATRFDSEEDEGRTLGETQVVSVEELHAPSTGMSRLPLSDTMMAHAPTTDMARTGIVSNPFQSPPSAVTVLTRLEGVSRLDGERTKTDLKAVRRSVWPLWLMGAMLLLGAMALWILTHPPG